MPNCGAVTTNGSWEWSESIFTEQYSNNWRQTCGTAAVRQDQWPPFCKIPVLTLTLNTRREVRSNPSNGRDEKGINCKSNSAGEGQGHSRQEKMMLQFVQHRKDWDPNCCAAVTTTRSLKNRLCCSDQNSIAANKPWRKQLSSTFSVALKLLSLAVESYT